MTGRRRRAIVVGATFGSVYAEALAAPQSPVDLVGLLSTGSDTSVELARFLNVSLYTAIDDLPPVDVAFVVVRSGIVGGDGTRICEQLLSRGIHVLQEQPVHADEIMALLPVAARNSVLYGVNDFYSSVPSVRQFISAAKKLNSKSGISYVHARSSLHVVYPLFTILANILASLTPSRISVLPCAEGPFSSGRLVLGRVPVDLLVQNELCASEPDNYARLMHTITLGSDAGELVLAHTHGSTRWYPRPRAADGICDSAISQQVGVAFEPTAETVRNELWPDAVRLAATEFVGLTGRARWAVSQRFVCATRLWSEYTSAMGPVKLIDPDPIADISASGLMVS